MVVVGGCDDEEDHQQRQEIGEGVFVFPNMSEQYNIEL